MPNRYLVAVALIFTAHSPAWAVPCPDLLFLNQSNLKVASLFSGRAQIESALATQLGIQIDAVDIVKPANTLPNINFIKQDLTKSSQVVTTKYDRVILISPWINPRTVFTFLEGPVESPFVPRPNDVVQPACGELVRGIPKTEGLSLLLLCERLAILFESVALAHERLADHGKILLLTELVHAYPVSPQTSPSTYDNRMIESDIHRAIAIRMLQRAFPDLVLTENDELKSRLTSLGSSDNPWGQSALKGWLLEKRK